MGDDREARRVVRVPGGADDTDGEVVVEAPMEIRLDGSPVAVVMRTPGDDADLALGFALTEGIVSTPGDVRVARLDGDRWDLRTAPGVDVDPGRFQRNFYATSSCGVCGKASIDAIRVAGVRPPPGPVVSVEDLLALPGRLAVEQGLFGATGGSHAAAVFAADGALRAVREDIGRHNAVDKVVGSLASTAWPIPEVGLLVSGRISFEIAQKAAVAGIGLVCGVSAASSLAIDLADEFSMTVVGFLRDGFTLYCGPQRIAGL